MSRFRTLENVFAVGSAMLVSISAVGAAQAQAAPAAPGGTRRSRGARCSGGFCRAPRRAADTGGSAPARGGDEPARPPRPRGARRGRGARRRRFAAVARQPGVAAGAARAARVRRPAWATSAGCQYFIHAEQTVEIGGQRSARRAVVSRALHTAELRVHRRAGRDARARAAPPTSARSWRWRASTRRPSARRWSPGCSTRSRRASPAGRRRTSIWSWRAWSAGAPRRARIDATLAAADADGAAAAC